MTNRATARRRGRASRLQELAAEGDEVDVRPVEHQLDSHQHAQGVALGRHADGAGDEQHGPDRQVMRHGDGSVNGFMTRRVSSICDHIVGRRPYEQHESGPRSAPANRGEGRPTRLARGPASAPSRAVACTSGTSTRPTTPHFCQFQTQQQQHVAGRPNPRPSDRTAAQLGKLPCLANSRQLRRRVGAASSMVIDDERHRASGQSRLITIPLTSADQRRKNVPLRCAAGPGRRAAGGQARSLPGVGAGHVARADQHDEQVHRNDHERQQVARHAARSAPLLAA